MTGSTGRLARVARGSTRPIHALEDAVGGPDRRTVVIVLAGVLGLQAADIGAVGAVAAPLERAFRIGNTPLGLLVTATTLVGCLVTLPFGVLSDRYSRTRLLQFAVAGWAVATVVSAFSTSFTMLLLSRLALGGVVAAAGPAVTSLVGDLVPSDQRSRLWGFVLTGELIGAGFGILVAGGLSGVTSWRIAIGVLALPAVVLVWALARYLPEPLRGGPSHLQAGAEAIVAAGSSDVADAATDSAPGTQLPGAHALEGAPPAERQAEAGGQPLPNTLLSGRESMNLADAIMYVLRVRTNVALIVASGLGYFVLAGLETFGELFFRGRYGVDQSTASLLFILVATGALIGVVASGGIADRLLAAGHTSARLTVAAVAYVVTTIIFVPAVLIGTLAIALPVMFLAAAGLGAVNPPVDAARLDVIPSFLWGRAEAVRTFFRQLLQGLAPVMFGLVSSAFGASSQGIGAGVDTRSAAASASASHGLEMAFLFLSLTLLISGVALWTSRHRYPEDLVAARRSDEHRAEVGL